MASEVVQVYKNLHKDCWSVRSRKTGRVIHHAETVVLYGAKPRVQDGGRRRVLREGVKNVHAFIEGTWWLDHGHRFLPAARMREVFYDPFAGPSFYYEGGEEATGPWRVVYFSASSVLTT